MPSSCGLLSVKFQKCPSSVACSVLNFRSAPVLWLLWYQSSLWAPSRLSSIGAALSDRALLHKKHWDSQLESVQERLKGSSSIFYYFLVAEFPLLLPKVLYVSLMQIPSIHELSKPTFREFCIDPSLICDSSSRISGDQGRLYPVLALKKQQHILNFPYSVDKPAGIVSHRCSLDRWTPGRAAGFEMFPNPPD